MKLEIKCDSATQMRLDVFLSANLHISRSQIPNLIKHQLITINGKIAKKAGVIIKEDDIIKVEKLSLDDNALYSVDFDIEIIYEDDEILVINKHP